MNHLWQSTWFVMAAALLAWTLRHNRAAIRYWIWFAASIKFLLPFAVLVDLGSRSPAAREIATPAVSDALVRITEPFEFVPAYTPASAGWRPTQCLVWACGFATPGIRSDRPTDPDRPSIFTAIRELGQKLDSGKGPQEFLVIDHVERPSQN